MNSDRMINEYDFYRYENEIRYPHTYLEPTITMHIDKPNHALKQSFAKSRKYGKHINNPIHNVNR